MAKQDTGAAAPRAAVDEGPRPYDQKKGCPVCGEQPAIDFPVYIPNVPAAYPALVYHYAYFHPNQEPPPPAHGTDMSVQQLDQFGRPVGDPPTPIEWDDGEALDRRQVQMGTFANGAPRLMTYREAIIESAQLERAAAANRPRRG